MFAVLLGGATALLPIVAKDILHTGPWGLGFIALRSGFRRVINVCLLSTPPFDSQCGKIMFAAVAIFGVATILFGLSENLILSMLALVLLGASDMISVVIRSTLVQLETPDDMRGRVSAANSVFIGSSNQLGEFESGVTAAWLWRGSSHCHWWSRNHCRGGALDVSVSRFAKASHLRQSK